VHFDQRHCSTSLQPVIRRLVTRLLGLIPSMTVAVVVGRNGIDTLLVASQVILSIILPFIIFPLVYLTSSSRIMRVPKTDLDCPSNSSPDPLESSTSPAIVPAETSPEVPQARDFVDFSNGKVMISVGCLIWIITVTANAYVLVELVIGG